MHSSYWPLKVFILLLILSSFASIPHQGGYVIAQSFYPEQGLTYTVYPNRTVAVDERTNYPTCCYNPNSQITHSIGIGETNNGTAEIDNPNPLMLTIGRNSSVSWYIESTYNPSNYTWTPPQYNHTVVVWGPETFNLTVNYPYQFYNNTYPPVPFPIHQFNQSGTYNFRTTAITTNAHSPSKVGQIYVIPSEEYEQPTENILITAQRQGNGGVFNAQYSVTLTPFELAQGYFFPFNDTDSFSLTGTYANGVASGLLTLHLLSGVELGLSDLTLPFVSNRTATFLNGNAVVSFNSALTGTPFENRTAFQNYFAKTFANASWVSILQQQVNSSTLGQIQLTSLQVPTPTYNDDTSAQLSFTITLSGDLLKYYLTGGYSSPTSNQLYNAYLALIGSASFVATFTQTSRTITVQVNSVLSSNIDAQLNQIKFIILNASRPYPSPSPPWSFEMATKIQFHSLTLQATLNANARREEVSVSLFAPPTVDKGGGTFTIPQLFEFTGYSQVNFTLQGGSDATGVVNLQIPKGVPTPNQKTARMAEWLNFNNFTNLETIVFAPTGAHSTLTSVAVGLEGLAIVLVAFILVRPRMKMQPARERGALSS